MDKTEDKVETIPFKRREKRDVSLSQITKDPKMIIIIII